MLDERSGQRTGRRTVRCLLGGLAALATGPAFAMAVSFQEDFGNFPDAVAVSAEFGNFAGTVIDGRDVGDRTGILWRVRNTSFTDPATGLAVDAASVNDLAAAFRNDPDGDFATSDVLNAGAADAIADAQPFGLHVFGFGLHADFAAFVAGGGSAGTGDINDAVVVPDGFQPNLESAPQSGFPNFEELNFELRPGGGKITDPGNAVGLLFDDHAAGLVPSPFTNARFGELLFFVETPAGFNPADPVSNPPVRNEQGFDVKTELAWAVDGAVATEFEVSGIDGGRATELRPRGQMVAQGAAPPQQVPEPTTLGLLAVALAGLATRRRRGPSPT